jgi:hypothetical protein
MRHTLLTVFRPVFDKDAPRKGKNAKIIVDYAGGAIGGHRRAHRPRG